MECPHCGTPHGAAARFCARCGTPLHPHVNREEHFAAHPDEPVRALALLSTLLPHVSGRRHHLYRNAVVFALLASAVAAAFGVLSVALICAAIALPAIVLTYLHDHHIWRDEPIPVIAAGFLLSLAFGVGIGFLQQHWTALVLLGGRHNLPPAAQILEVGIVVPVIIFLLLLVAPLAVTSKPVFRHALDAVNVSSLAGAALSLGLSIVIQHGAFSAFASDTIDPGRAFFIAMTLGFAQPVLFSTAAAIAAMRIRRPNANPVAGVVAGLLLVVIYELAATLLSGYGPRGIVLTALIAAFLAAAGLLLVRHELHDALLSEARAALAADTTTARAAAAGQHCAHCGVELGAGAAFCQVCGTAVAAQPVHRTASDAAGAPAPSAA
jgi:predicted amidophosphoribosyltransferase